MRDTETLWEVIDLADIAVRVASQLRLRKMGRKIWDKSALEKAIQFLQSAAKGGIFLSGKGIVGGFDGSLRPLNWATDTYLRQREGDQPVPDYSEVAQYLDAIQAELSSAMADGTPTNELDDAIFFFEKLGELLSGQADQSLQAQPYNADFNQTALW